MDSGRNPNSEFRITVKKFAALNVFTTQREPGLELILSNPC